MKDTHKTEIDQARSTTSQTLRPTSPALEAILHEAFPVLDHGFVRVVDYMGDDAAIVQAARVSYGRGTTRVSDDRGLIRYLMRHRHSTPLEMCEIKLHVKLPIFVARQWIRHRTASVNEYSARYSVLDREFYLPRPEDLAEQSSTNRQGRGEVLSPEQSFKVLQVLRGDAERCYDSYEHLLNEGEDRPEDPRLARELARMNLTLNYYTQWYWKIDLHNLLHFLGLRMDSHAQKEIRAYADAIAGITSRWVPLAWEAYRDYRFDGAVLSRMEVEAVKTLLRGQMPDYKALGMSARETREFEDRFGADDWMMTRLFHLHCNPSLDDKTAGELLNFDTPKQTAEGYVEFTEQDAHDMTTEDQTQDPQDANPGEAPQHDSSTPAEPGKVVLETVHLEELPPEKPETEPMQKVLEEAYFHINNGGLTLRVVEQVEDPQGYPDSRQLALQVRASHFGRGVRVEVPLLGRAAVAYLAEVMIRVGEYLEANPHIKLHGPFDEPEPWYKVVKGTGVPRRVVRHSCVDGGIAVSYTENNTAEMAAQVLGTTPRADRTEECRSDLAAQGMEAGVADLRKNYCARCNNAACPCGQKQAEVAE